MRGVFDRLLSLPAVCIFLFMVCAGFVAEAGWQHQVLVITDVPDMSVYVDGEFRTSLDNSGLSADADRWYLGDKTKGGYAAFVDLGDFERHKIHVGSSSPRSGDGFYMRAMVDTPNLSRFVSLGRGVIKDSPPPPPVVVACPHCQKKNPADAEFCVSCGKSMTLGPPERLPELVANWVSEPAGAVSLILGATLLLAVAVIVAVVKHSRTPPTVGPQGEVALQDRPLNVPTIIGQGWPYVMFQRYPAITPIQRIGSGGVATVFLAEVPKHGRVAVKILHEHQSTDRELRHRFLQEARVLRKLSGTGVVPLAFGMSPEDFVRPWFTMTYLGQMYRLRDMIGGAQQKQLSLDWAYPVAAALCSSVEAIHRAGVVHRDLSPENVMYGFGSGMEVKLIDFDSAKMRGANLSRAGLAEGGGNGDVVGKVKYTSPEQWASFDAAGIEADAYSVGVMIWEMITGSSPFTGSTIDEIREQHIKSVREVATLTRHGVPGQLAALLAALLDPDLSQRPQLSMIRSHILEMIGG